MAMDRQQARRIIQETFEKPFDKSRFTHFIKNLLNRIEEAPFAYHGQFIPEAYRPYISTLERIGKFNDGENRIDILIIRLQKETSIERARTNQRNFVAGYLQGKYGSSNEKEAALVAFVSPDEEDWRFSLVKMDYKFEQTTTGKMRVKEEFTPARRWSFLVGANENSHTAQSRLVKILADDDNDPTLAKLEEAFNIETVTKEFFLKYRDLFIRTKEALDKVVENDGKIKADFETKGVNTVDFAKKLLGQIVFLYFLQKKGWFGVARDAEWGAGSKQFLRELFEKKHSGYKNFFNDILEPLFYEALRVGEERQQDDYYYSRFNCKIPFLNGGLFDPIGNYDWVKTDILLPDSLFSNKNKTREGDEGDGILDVFDRYNFTVKEDEPLEKEVAIDPELLGKAYEKFNAIRPDNFEEYKKALKSGRKGDESKFNKQFGVYYTPREIVHYMCQQSLINYLFTELNSGTTSYEKLGDSNLDMLGNEVKKGQLDITIKHKNPEISKEDIETLIHLGEQVGENEARVLSKGKETKTYYHQLPESIRKNAKQIDDKLENITVCDPAVGSGAFPVGMMSEIVKARSVLNTFIADKDDCTPYHFKRRCIEHSLYGVDIDPGAVEIAKLRLWLSLVVDEDDIKDIKPLPNLDYKIVCGNSLLGVEINLFNNQLFNDLETVKPLYFNETNPTKKQEYKKQIDDLISRITNGHKEFDFEVYFSEVFHEKSGFDVVIANPPYGAELKESDIRNLIKKFKYFDSQRNSASFFLELAANLCGKKKGTVTFIIPKSLSFSEGWKLTRELVSIKNQLTALVDVSKAFEDVLLEQVIVCFQTLHSPLINYNFKVGEGWSGTVTIFSILNSSLIKELDILPIYIDKSKQNIYSKIIKNAVLLSKISDTFRGLPVQKFISEKGQPVLRGKNIGKYSIYGNIDKVSLDSKFNKKATNILHTKIVSQNIVAHVVNPVDRIIIMATIDTTPFLTFDTVMNTNIIDAKFDIRYVLALLNSGLASWFYYWFVYNRAIRTMHFDKYYIGKLPIKIISETNQKPFIELVDKIFSLTQSDDYLENPDKQVQVKEYEKEINQIVYELYGLTEEEIKIVEGKG